MPDVATAGLDETAFPSPSVGKAPDGSMLVVATADVVGVEVGAGVDVGRGTMEVIGTTFEVDERIGKGVAESWPSRRSAVAEPANRMTIPRSPADSTRIRRGCGNRMNPLQSRIYLS